MSTRPSRTASTSSPSLTCHRYGRSVQWRRVVMPPIFAMSSASHASSPRKSLARMNLVVMETSAKYPLLMLPKLIGQPTHEVGGRQGPGERRALPRPLRPVAGLAGRFRGSVECLARVVGDRVRGNLPSRHGGSQIREAISQTTCGAPRDGAGHDRVVRGI